MRFTSDELNERVRRVIMNARPTIDNRITKEEIAHKVYGRYTPSIDRSIRDAVTELVMESDSPICATSDQPGYYIARNLAEAEPCIRELTSRAKVYFKKIKGIKRALAQLPDNPVQLGLL